MPMKIMKFGGSSLGNAERIVHVAKVIKQYLSFDDIVVVVSAMYGVTDKLIYLFDTYKAADFEKAHYEMALLYKAHREVLDELRLGREEALQEGKKLFAMFGQLSMYLLLCKRFSMADYDYVISFGERWNSLLTAAVLKKCDILAQAIDASDVMVATSVYGNAKVIIDKTEIKAQKLLNPLIKEGVTPVVTGFFAGTKEGKVVTLGRGGSDYTAAILGYALNATEVILWKEVDGVFSRDPKKDGNAIFYPYLSYKKALALAKQGAKVLHPEAMRPVSSKNIVVRVKNTFKPEWEGTKIWKEES